MSENVTAVRIIDCQLVHAPAICEIINDAILHSLVIYEENPRTTDWIEQWISEKHQVDIPLIGAVDDQDRLLGYATYGPFRPQSGFRQTVEHSVYMAAEARGRGIGKQLLVELIRLARLRPVHVMVGTIDSENHASLQLHRSLGFQYCGDMREVGFKGGQRLHMQIYQMILSNSNPPAIQPPPGELFC